MGCKNSKSKECQNRFDTRSRSESRHESKRGETPRGHSRTPSATPRSSRDKEAQREKEEERRVQAVRPKVHVTPVPITLARFESLPADCIKRYVYRVYDGDTITLRGEDNAKVRLLAMDTPEMQDNEPFAVEARDFVAHYILDKKVYLGFEGVEKDRYGRYLAYVFVKDTSTPPFRYLCVNIAVVESGLGNYYHPQGTPLSMDQIFLEAQSQARSQGINIWNGVDESYEVYLTPHGHAFHTRTCTRIQNVPLSCMPMKDALDMGHYACRDCHPNWASKLPSKEKLLSAAATRAKVAARQEGHEPLTADAAEDAAVQRAVAADGSLSVESVTEPTRNDTEGDTKCDLDIARENVPTIVEEVNEDGVLTGLATTDGADAPRTDSPPHRPSTNRDSTPTSE